MAALKQKFNSAENKAGMEDRSALPEGKYLVIITKSDYKATKAGTGHYLNLTMKVVEGPKKGNVVFALMNLENPNPVAVDIANKELNSICQACGKASVEDSDELHGIPMLVTVKIRKGNADYPDSNSVSKYEAYTGDGDFSAEAAAATAASAPPAAEATQAELPWEEDEA
ncbi:MAG: hypothetical protein DRP42_05700 [Tenericutes bacterium]|nr:MAG: hypothetical protein DRP42_05700 [Mycoplasmatota bacterium]